MQEADIQSLAAQVLWAAFFLSTAFGAIAQRTHFCTMGAVADIVNIGDWTRMRMWVLAIGVAIVGFNVMVGLGWVSASNTIYGGPRLLWLSALVGGFLFGVGMVLASGCGSKTLIRIGGGNLKSVVVFMAIGIAAFATMRGITGVLRVNTVDALAVTLPFNQDLPSVLSAATGVPLQTLALVLGLAVGGACILWALARPEGRSGDSLLAGFGVGAVIVGVWVVSGLLGHVEEHPSTLEEAFLATNSQRMESLSFVAPVAYSIDWLIFFSDKSKVLTLGIVSVLGVIVGSALYALFTRSFRWEGFASTEDTANHLAGGLLMGVGGVTAMGCTVGQGLSGISTLGLTSFIAVAAIVAGGVAALKYQVWRLEQQI